MKSWLIFTLCAVAWTSAQQGPCFEFDGDSYLEFEPENLDLSDSIHYTLTFQTTEPNGILLYTAGSHDYEALYVRDGILTYDLVNPDGSGVGGSSGARIQSNTNVDTNKRIIVELFRNRRVHRDPSQLPAEAPPLRTGMTLKIEGESYEEEHFVRPQNGVNLQFPIYIGGSGRDLSDTVHEFKGQISDISEKKSSRVLMDPTRNIGVTRCLRGRPPM